MTVDLYIIKASGQDVLDAAGDPGRFSEYRRSRIMSTKNFSSRCLEAAAGIATDKGLGRFGLKECEVRYILNEYGKPVIEGHPEIIFNISHSGEYAVAAFLNETEEKTGPEAFPAVCGEEKIKGQLPCIYDIGVDIERIARKYERIASFMKNDAGFGNGNEKKDLCRRWTAREAFLKCVGTGLSSIREDYHIEQTETGKLKLCQDIYEGEFSLAEPEAPEGYCITYVVRKRWERDDL